jgi:hypothetical protein
LTSHAQLKAGRYLKKSATHLRTVEVLAKTARPAIVIAASGMCSGGRIDIRAGIHTLGGFSVSAVP